MYPKKWWQLLLLSLFAIGFSLTALVALAVVLIYPELPSLEVLTDYRPKIPLRVYSEDGLLIAEFGEERRALVKIENVPTTLKQAIIAAEDERFYQHGGVDTLGVLRAALANATARGAKEGASTITMQVARNFFLSSEKTLQRKLSEALLAIKIEHNLSKDKILELYINQIYLGQRAYGFAAAAQVYYGKPLKSLNTAELAMLAGLPKAPSRYNPYANLKRSAERQRYVLRRMLETHAIDEKEYKLALEQPLRLKKTRQSRDLAADFVAEIVRQELYSRYQDDIYKSGLKVYTTIRKNAQEAANEAVLQGILDYDRRHGYGGAEGFVDLQSAGTQAMEDFLDDALDEPDAFQGLIPAVVLAVNAKMVKVHLKDDGTVQITGDSLQWAKKMLDEKAPAKKRLRPGAIIRVRQTQGQWHITQLPQVEAALIGLDPKNGAVRALVGGFDYNRNKFNHVTQAWRQPGSSFKPFIYSAALEKGFTTATAIDDAPLTLSAAETGSGQAWEPQNYDRKFEGPMRMRTALTKSKNMVSIRILQSIGVDYAQDYITRFGFSAKDHPPYLAMALGAGSVTPWQMARGYAVFANGGYRITPYLIDKIVDSSGRVIEQAKPVVAGRGAPLVIDPRNAYLMSSMMQDVTRFGTAARARELGRYDLAGKTGTTNNQIDAWFAGYNPNQVAVAWIGYDKPKSLGGRETGGQTALPMWIRYMSQVLKGVPDEPAAVPAGIVSVKINPATGNRAPEEVGGLYEYFYSEFTPSLPDPFETPLTPENAPARSNVFPQLDQLY